jgi:hypothetical protein
MTAAEGVVVARVRLTAWSLFSGHATGLRSLPS